MLNIIPNVDTRKEHTKYLINVFDKLSERIISDKKTRGYILFTFHFVLVYSALLIIFFSKLNIYFYISSLLWIIIVYLHIYFGGCIFIRIERELLDDKSWKGIWTYLFYTLEYIGYKLSDKDINNIFIFTGIIISFIVFLKFIYYL